MATVTLSAGHPFPVGTSVKFVSRANRNEVSDRRGATPHKSETVAGTAVVAADRSLACTGLTSGQWYWAQAAVNGTPIWIATLCP